MVISQADMCDPGWNEIDVGYGAQERFLHEVVRTVDFATE